MRYAKIMRLTLHIFHPFSAHMQLELGKRYLTVYDMLNIACLLKLQMQQISDEALARDAKSGERIYESCTPDCSLFKCLFIYLLNVKRNCLQLVALLKCVRYHREAMCTYIYISSLCC